MILSDFSILFEEILQNPTKSAIIIANLILIESLLSIDNAAVLATMVMDLPEKQRKKHLSMAYGAHIYFVVWHLFSLQYSSLFGG